MEEMLNILFRTVITLVVLFILIRIMGKKQVSQLNLFDYMIGISIGSVAADISLDIEKNFLGGLMCMIICGLLNYVVSAVSLKSGKFKDFFAGTSTMLIKDGKILSDNLRKVNLSISDLLAEARSNSYFNLNDIDEAIMETSGKISFLLKKDQETVTVKDMNITKNEVKYYDVVIDGIIKDDNLKNLKKDRKWLMQQLKVLGYTDEKKLLLVIVDSNEKVNVYLK
ncbi:MAG: DUF421 domain-containing protein [bacterium]|nr:DUF421 domain-containing protein [bacterium]